MGGGGRCAPSEHTPEQPRDEQQGEQRSGPCQDRPAQPVRLSDSGETRRNQLHQVAFARPARSRRSRACWLETKRLLLWMSELGSRPILTRRRPVTSYVRPSTRTTSGGPPAGSPSGLSPGPGWGSDGGAGGGAVAVMGGGAGALGGTAGGGTAVEEGFETMARVTSSPAPRSLVSFSHPSSLPSTALRPSRSIISRRSEPTCRNSSSLANELE